MEPRRSALHGAFAPLLTPFRGESLEVDDRTLRTYVRFSEDHGMKGLVVLGTNGEFHSLSFPEKFKILREVASCRGNLILIAGTATTSAHEALRIAEEAATLGYDGVLALPPYYPQTIGEDGVFSFFSFLLKRSPLPVLLYHIPAKSGFGFSPNLMKRILGEGPVAGIKDSSGDFSSLRSFRECLPNVPYFVGNDRLILAALRLGAAGSITAASNPFPEAVLAVREGQRKNGGEKEQGHLDGLRALLDEVRSPAASKHLLSLRGLPESRVRPPFRELDAEEKKRLRLAIQSLEVFS